MCTSTWRANLLATRVPKAIPVGGTGHPTLLSNPNMGVYQEEQNEMLVNTITDYWITLVITELDVAEI